MNDKLQQALQWALNNDKGLKAMGASMNDLTAIYPYHNQGQEVFIKARFDKDGKKWIKPFFFDGNRYKMGEPKHLDTKPLYLPAPLGDVVYIVEGEKCVDRLVSIGLSATTTGGATSIDKCDLTPLQGRKCVLWRDNDTAGEKWQGELITALNRLNIAYEVIDITGVMLPTGERLPVKGDCVDFIESHLQDGNAGVKSLIERLPRLDGNAITNDTTNNAQITDSNDTATALADLDAQVQELQQAIKELAELDEHRLHLLLSRVAKRFGVGRDKLLQWVYEHKQGELVQEPTAHHEPISHDEIYTALYGLIDRHIFINEPLKVAFVLWVLFTYLTDIAEFAPIAWITAPERACGKTTLLDLFERVVYRPYAMLDPTKAVIFRVMDKFKPTLLIDEIDTGLKDKADILGIINGGYSKGKPTGRINSDKGNSLEAFNGFGAKVLCGIGNLQGTTASRCIRFEMKRKGKSDKVTPMNKRTLPFTQTELIRQKCKRWAMDNRQAVDGVEIPLIDISDRAYNSWYILLQIATVLGVYDKALQACLSICQTKDEPSQHEQLLHDTREVWHGEKMALRMLLERLTALDEALWQTYNNGQEMTAHQLGKKLRGFGIDTQTVKTGASTSAKGYYKTQFVPVWERYLSPKVNESEF
ncbi:MAG: DUF3631 domain-containing protein [Moraxella sp.]|nr:DUF3631 domain-containing protein [Moraxella sp.]